MKTTIIYSVNGREIGRDTYNKSLLFIRGLDKSIEEMININPNVKISIKTE